MNSDWRQVSIKQVCERITSGGTPRSTEPAYYEGGTIPWLTTSEVNYNIIRETERHITPLGLENSAAKVVPQDTVIVAMYGRGTAGRVAMAGKPLTTNQACCNLIIDRTIANPRYVFYALWHDFARLDSLATGSVQQNLSARVISDFEIDLPPLREQDAIASMLGALDDKIELNRRMSENLSETIRAIFKAWFLEFSAGPAKDQELKSLPNGKILPVNWDFRPLVNFADVVYGAPFASKAFQAPGVGKPLIRIRDLRSMECSAWTTEIHRNGHLIHPGDIVVGMDGEFRRYIWLGSPAWLNQRVCHFEPLADVPRGYVFSALEPELALLERSKTGTTVIHLSKRDIDSLEFLWPGAAVLREFGNLVEPLLDRIVVATAESQTLKHIRDALLPKLISAELRISDAENLVSEVA